MLSKIKKSNSEGFTIIEVMIVLAVAALILLIVLLAVPALTRSSRNTALKNDVSTVTGAISTYESDNNGTIPTYIAGTGTVDIGVETKAGGDANQETAQIQGGTTAVLEAAGGPTTGAGAPTKMAPSTIYVLPQSSCAAADTPGGTAETASAETFALYYLLQTSAGSTTQCVNS